MNGTPTPASTTPPGYGMLIDGAWITAQSGETIDVIDPSTEGVVATIAAGDASDIDHAVQAARRAFDSGIWSGLPAIERSKRLWKLAELLERDAASFAASESMDNGMPLAMARGLAASSADSLRYWAGWAGKTPGITTTAQRGPRAFMAYTTLEPIGVVGLITPWNFPLAMACWKIGPALAAGCCCVLKPAELTSLTALKLGALISEASIPDGVVNIVTGYGHIAGAALVAHPMVDKISFTGSTLVGKQIVQAATGNLKRVSLELGGKSPFIILEDADLATAIPTAAHATFINAGQICIAGTRVYAHRSVFDRVVEGISEVARSMKLGAGTDPATQMGPLISGRQRERVLGYVESGIADGAEVAAGGTAVGGRGYFFAPTVLTNTRPDMRVVREEIFGPVITVMPFDDLDGVVRDANDSDYGLAASIWTGSLDRAHGLARRLQAGSIWLNSHLMVDDAVPFGGYKQSGWGRENGYDGIKEYLQTKAVFTPL